MSASTRVFFQEEAGGARRTKKREAVVYPLAEGIRIMRAFSRARFDETVELHVQLNLDVRKNQTLRGAATLPHGTGKAVRVAVFAKGDKATEARNAGADIVGEQDLATAILEGRMEFDRCIASPDMMAIVGKVARILGPRGLMPNPKLGTVTADVAEAVRNAKQGQVEFKSEKTGVIQAGIGKLSFTDQQITNNITAFVKTLLDLKPTGLKGDYVKRAQMSSTMGPGIPIATNVPPFKSTVAGPAGRGAAQATFSSARLLTPAAALGDAKVAVSLM